MPPVFQLKSRWAWIVCALLLAGFLTNSISDYLVARKNVRTTIAESTLPLTSDNVYSEIQRDLLQPIFIASLMASDTFLRDWAIEGEQDMSSIVKYLHEIKIKYGTITSFFVSDNSLKYYYAHGLLKTVSPDEPRDEWYFRVRDMEAPYEINVDPDMANRDEMTIFINYRAKDYAGNFIGATGVGLTVNKVNNLISSYEAKYNRQIYFVDAEGKIVLRPSNSPMLEYASLQEIEGLDQKFDGLLAGTTDSLTYHRGGENRIMNCRFVPELEWYLIVEQSEEVMLAPLRQQLYINILTALVMTAMVGGICIYVVRSHQAGIEKRNRELTENAQLINKQKQELHDKAREWARLNGNLQTLNREKDEFLGIVDGVEEWMAVIISNLISNAVKFSPQYSTVTIRTERSADCILTHVEDTGPGIRSNEQDKLFQKFVRLSAKPTGTEHSTGLGLYIVKKMCDRLNIGIEVRSEFGRGTTFTLKQTV